MNPSVPTDKPHRLLFICSHNSARSIMAEGLLNALGGGRFQVFSAGSQPAGTVQPQALRTLELLRLPTAGYRSKSWSEFAAAGAPPMDFVITVCDQAAGEVCPVWPGQPITAHWGVPDPAAVQGSAEQIARAYWEAAQMLKRRIELMLALPLASLQRLSLQQALREIGQR